MKNFKYAILFIVVMLLPSCKRREVIINPDQSIHHDDFEYSVVSFEKRKQIVFDSTNYSSEGVLLIVNFKVVNRALRVGHKWKNSIACIVSDRGDVYENSIRAQQILNRAEPFNLQENYNTSHGTSEVTRLVFDIPADMSHSYLMVRGETLMGDVFNRNQFLRTKIKLF